MNTSRTGRIARTAAGICSGLALVFSCALVSQSALAAIYRVVDANGNVTYTDQAPASGVTEATSPGKPSAERIEITPPNTFVDDTPRARYEPETADAAADAGYTLLQITGPSDEKVIRANDGRVYVGVRVSPELQAGHRLLLEMDGSLTDKTPVSGSIDLVNVPRGTHRIRLVVVDAGNKRLIESPEQVFHMQRFSQIINQQQQQRRAQQGQ